jgi:hypothetical protein
LLSNFYRRLSGVYWRIIWVCFKETVPWYIIFFWVSKDRKQFSQKNFRDFWDIQKYIYLQTPSTKIFVYPANFSKIPLIDVWTGTGFYAYCTSTVKSSFQKPAPMATNSCWKPFFEAPAAFIHPYLTALVAFYIFKYQRDLSLIIPVSFGKTGQLGNVFWKTRWKS